MIHLYNPQLSAGLSLSRDKTRNVFSTNILSPSQGLAKKQGKKNWRVRRYFCEGPRMCVSRDQAEAANTGVGFCKNTCYMVGYFPPTVNRPGAEFSHPRPELKRGGD